ncbi:MAG TPA: hypothetical protein VF746_01680 [Longimicrobium sp.]|jgi:hypothetical protein
MRAASFARPAVGGCAVLLALAGAGCSALLFADEEERVIATISHYGDGVKAEIPDVATRGVAFDVTVTSYGGGCVLEGDTEVEVQGSTAVVTPYDVELRPRNGACTDDLRFYRHAARVRFDTPGQATVTVRGVRKPEGDVVTVQKTVTVQ